MKTIGRTNNGDFLVEMTKMEHNLFEGLNDVAEGLFPHDFRRKEFINSDFEKVFHAINWWMELQYNINGLRASIEELETAMGKHENSN